MDGTTKKDRRQKTPGAEKKMHRKIGADGAEHVRSGASSPESEMDDGLSPNLQAHIGRHVRAVFDEVAREPIPEHLLRLLKDLERSGDK